MKKHRPLIICCTIFLVLSGCVILNSIIKQRTLSQKLDRWVTIRDSKTGRSLPDIPLVYGVLQKPYLIVGHMVESEHYISGIDSRVHVPSNVIMIPSGSNGYDLDESKYSSIEEKMKHDSIFIRLP